MTRAWVLGSGGMLGSSVSRELKRQGIKIYRYSESLDWRNTERLQTQLRLALIEFLVSMSPDEPWEIYWAAGVGAMGSSKADLDTETGALSTLLSLLDEMLPHCRTQGFIGFASSAGALYSGCIDFEITEASPVTAVTDYAKAKLEQEQLLQDFAARVAGIGVLIARFTTLYGAGQSFGKQQGLLSHIVRCVLKHQPVEIFVPLDTSRDYLFSDDAACDFIGSLRALDKQPTGAMIKIIAAERSVTISEIIATINRLIKSRIRVVCSRTSLSNLYATRVAYRSLHPLATDNKRQRHTMLEGISILLQAEHTAYLNGLYRK